MISNVSSMFDPMESQPSLGRTVVPGELFLSDQQLRRTLTERMGVQRQEALQAALETAANLMGPDAEGAVRALTLAAERFMRGEAEEPEPEPDLASSFPFAGHAPAPAARCPPVRQQTSSPDFPSMGASARRGVERTRPTTSGGLSLGRPKSRLSEASRSQIRPDTPADLLRSQLLGRRPSHSRRVAAAEAAAARQQLLDAEEPPPPRPSTVGGYVGEAYVALNHTDSIRRRFLEMQIPAASCPNTCLIRGDCRCGLKEKVKPNGKWGKLLG